MFNQSKIKDLERKVRDLEYELECRKELFDKNRILQAENYKIIAENNEIRSKIRTQTEANLYFECEKIKVRLLNEEKKESMTDSLAYKTALQAQLAQQMPYSSCGSSILDGLGSAFGWH